MKKAFFLILCAFQCMIIACIRVDIGTDYRWYTYGFRDMSQTGLSDLTYQDWEIGFILFNKFVAIFTNNAAVFIGVCAAFSLSGTFYLIWKYSKDPFVSVFLFLNTYLFYLDLNYVRQSIAMSIMCFAYGFLKDRKFWRFLLLCVWAATFHLPVIYLIPVFFVTLVKINLKTLPIYAGVLVLYFIVSDPILNVLLQHFHTEYADSRFIKNGITYYYTFFPLLISIGMVVLAFYLKFKLSQDLTVLTHLMLLMGFWQIVMMKHALFERFSYYTMPFMLIAVPEAISVFKDKFSRSCIAKAEEQSKGNDADVVDQPDQHDDQEVQDVQKNQNVMTAQRKAEKKVAMVVFAITAAVLLLAFAYNMMGLIVPAKGVHGVLPFKARGFKLPNIDSWFKR